MGRRLTRHDMVKQDEFVTGVTVAAAWLERHRRLLLLASGTLAGLLLVGAGASWLLRSRGADADRLLGEALEIRQAPIIDPGAAAPPGSARTFGSGQQRDQEVLSRLERVISRHPFSRAATVAAFVRGTTLLSLGRSQDARDTLTAFTRDYASSELVPLAREALARAEVASGNAPAAVEICRALVETPSPLLPADSALMSLARAQEAAGQPQEAAETYRRLLNEYPQSIYSGEAGQAIARLNASHPSPAA